MTDNNGHAMNLRVRALLHCILINSSLRAQRVKLAAWQSLQTPLRNSWQTNLSRARDEPSEIILFENVMSDPAGALSRWRARAQFICAAYRNAFTVVQ